MNFKKISALIAAAALSMTMAVSCGNNGDSEEETPTREPFSVGDNETYDKINNFQAVLEDIRGEWKLSSAKDSSGAAMDIPAGVEMTMKVRPMTNDESLRLTYVITCGDKTLEGKYNYFENPNGFACNVKINADSIEESDSASNFKRDGDYFKVDLADGSGTYYFVKIADKW